MGREVRRVHKDWQHPKREDGRHIPLWNVEKLTQRIENWDKEAKLWNGGFCYGRDGKLEPLSDYQKSRTYLQWVGDRPDPEKHMPEWREEELTHLMMYEDTSEGTPISPAFTTAEELIQWLVDNKAPVFAYQTASYETWMSIVENSANSLVVMVPGRNTKSN
ncbi:MAG: hypothetical protein PHQ58_04655 [Rhodoferax sp.]|uniref:hypothetical protein n=1 Tax=Rhodoferax sp. TaxID=50421 RepID=UPI0026051081|nr:hypothetical protein [Rhodoferax sp.]MDD2879703.1 hypothetical protein [Rhodoferax sp.]